MVGFPINKNNFFFFYLDLNPDLPFFVINKYKTNFT